LLELACHAQFVLDAHAASGSLLAIPQSGVKDPDDGLAVAVIHEGLPFVPSHHAGTRIKISQIYSSSVIISTTYSISGAFSRKKRWG
jgi:hypothetical protein